MSDSQMNLLTIPHDLHVEILSFIPLRHLLVYSRCCQHFKKVTEDDRLWANREAIPLCFNSQIPSARVCHAAVVYNDSLLVYGGDGSRDDKIDDVKGDFWAYKFQEGGKWQEIPATSQRAVLTEHSAVLYQNSIFIYGGTTGGTNAYVLGNTTHQIDLGTTKLKEVSVKGKVPTRGSAHSAVVYKDKMYVYGGWDGRVSHGDFFELDLKTFTWSQVHSKGESPGKRRAHCAVVHDHYMYVFGGYDQYLTSSSFSQMFRFDFESGEWEKFFGTGEVPRGRSRADMVVYQDKIYVFGGVDRHVVPNEYFSDLCEFNIKTHAWKIYQTTPEDQVNGISQHKCVLYKHWLLVVFGYSALSGASTNKMFAINLQRKATK